MSVPDLVVVGHLARDLAPDGSYQLGGTVTYAALLAARMGLRVGVLTSAPQPDVDALAALDSHIDIVAVPTLTATIFENHYSAGQRVQYLRASATPLTSAALPPAWSATPLALLGPIADEIAPNLATGWTSVTQVGATPQGWLRRWDATGRVWPRAWDDAAAVLPNLTALILSVEDLAIAAGAADGEAIVREWAMTVPYVVLTAGPQPARLWVHGIEAPPVPTIPVAEVDPTGAGDCFATTFCLALRRTGDPLLATRLAHRVAAWVVRAPGIAGIPSTAQLQSWDLGY